LEIFFQFVALIVQQPQHNRKRSGSFSDWAVGRRNEEVDLFQNAAESFLDLFHRFLVISEYPNMTLFFCF
jgi:hypothetical protein